MDLGWGISSYRGHYNVEHGGGIDGFISSTGFFPSDSIGIFVASNQGAPVSVIRNFIADRMLKLSSRNWNKNLLDAADKARAAEKTIVKNDSASHKYNTKPSHSLSDYAGVFANTGYGKFEVTAKDTGLVARFNTIDIRLDHVHYDQFDGVPLDPSFDGSEPIRISFHIDDHGDIDHLSIPLESGTKDIEFKKEKMAMDLMKADLEKYLGDLNYSLTWLLNFISKARKPFMRSLKASPNMNWSL